ncbi:MAG TPA: zinc-dependent metalloprotease [Actinomycetales bacterium]|nr:zinc-dependent metalloprotease [Actinomycetales bacterium]
MTDVPSGPGQGEDDEPRDDLNQDEQPDLSDLLGQLMSGGMPGIDPAQLAAAGVPTDPAALGQVLAQVQRMLTTAGEGPVNWDLAQEVARQSAAAGGDPSVGDAARREVVEALRLAELWLDGVTTMPSSAGPAQAWSRAEWVEETLGTWRRVAEPVAESVAVAMGDAMAQQAPEEMRPMMAAAGKMMRQVGGAVFGMQVGQAVGALAGEVVSSSDIGLPLAASPGTALLPANVTAFGEGLDVPTDELRLYLALREAAHARLFGHVGWLRGHLLGAVESYARGISIDTARIEEAVSGIDPTDPQALQQALSSGVFEPERTPAQQVALDRLETALALVEGWVDEVVDSAAAASLPHAAALRETMRRRRAAGGPAEHTLASLVGLELRPRRLRDAAILWATLEDARGLDGRDAVWEHPDLLPVATDLDDPTGFAARRGDAEAASADVDAALEKLLRDERPDGA